MKTDGIIRNSAIISATLASLCCIAPVLAIVAGMGGLASSFSFLEPLRPFFIVFTGMVLGIAFYSAYKPGRKKETECACDNETSLSEKKFLRTKTFLWIVTIIAVLLITFPYYSAVLLPETKRVEKAPMGQIMHARLDIEGMTCSGCENTLDYILKSEEGVIRAKSFHETGTAYIEYNAWKVNPEDLKNTIEKKTAYRVKNIQREPKTERERR